MTALVTRVAASARAARSREIMRLARGIIPACSLCKGPRDGEGRYCRRCRATYMREWRRQQRETPREKRVGS